MSNPNILVFLTNTFSQGRELRYVSAWVIYQRKNIEQENDEIGHLCDRGSRVTAVLLRRCWWVIFVTIELRQKESDGG